MRSFFFSFATGLAIAGFSFAVPTESTSTLNILAARAVSPDNTCGNSFAGANNSYSCDMVVNEGGCCSTYGYCGNSTDYCGTGCQTAFGTCNPEAVENTFECGTAYGNLACTGGLCCSAAGFCGNTTDYCDASNGCQSTFGVCNVTDVGGGAGGVCGPNNGNIICPDNQCCSVSGYCGTTEDFCSDPNNCALGFGRCDSDTTPAGLSTLNTTRPLLGPVSYNDDIDDCVQSNVVALSYDDGPYLYTSQLLDILKSYGFTATFFITGNNNGKGAIDTTDPYPSLIKRMIAEGHQVASHTWSHYSLDNVTQEIRIQQMIKNEMALNNIIGKWPTYMRPPFSQCSQASGCQADMQALGYHRVYFDLDTQDYLNPSPLQIQNSKNIVETALQVSGVTDYLSIQHDIVQQSVTNLTSYYFDLIQAKGWKGVTVGQCLGDDQKNWYRSLSSTTTSTSAKSSTTSSATSSASTSKSTSSVEFTTTSRASSSVTSTKLTSSSRTSSTSRIKTSTSSQATSSSRSSAKSATTTMKTSSTSKLPSTTSTSKKSSPTPAPPKCIKKIGSFCGNIDTFDDQASCFAAASDCSADSYTCMAQGWTFISECYPYTSVCTSLYYYCFTCGWTSCSNQNFGLGS